ncbi:PTPLA-domain-containing protein [Aureobasidium pullulans]|uniref:Very-long-chain (3R)-3-hydroxyacyl-CoA dehydratase n=1 Tax=Aureobasidium pullulans TaxID=5580 RepID=A0A4S8ZGJ6_AURPU|nr:PTPLA-domain-containing protein [Aureobasidium pullulans]THZ82251.1 PTPLA-domain-containing protein [Aureobasidium pullulans]TIA42846.1 PTPLA-domain-containing protein [Aureobasidium pullulans]
MADRPQQPARPAAERKSSPLKTGYLVLYNAISTILWGTILGRVLLIAGVHGTRYVFPGVGEFAKWTQTLALLEVVHAAVGIVRAPLFTTLMQVASRILLIWGIVTPFPNTVAFSPIYSTMLIAWSITEVIRYSYFAINLSTGSVPSFWLWLRYNTFFVLYPLGISSECWLVWLAASGPAKQYTGVREGLFAVLLIYVPGSYILFTHMMAQRRKIMRGTRAKVN